MSQHLLSELNYWIDERESIRRKKKAGLPKPWSEDEVFQNVYFCNVHREHDKVTRYIRQNFTNDQPNLIPRLGMCRLVNRIPSLQALGPMYEWNPDHFRIIAEKLTPFWGNAYVVTTHGQRMSKVEYAVGVISELFEGQPCIGPGATLASAHALLTTFEGFGSFMAAQVVADLKNTDGHPLWDAVDWRTWSAPGPGSLRGLSWYYGRTSTPASYSQDIQGVADELDWRYCMQDLQNCMCEFDKYMRVKTGQGRSKRKYNGTE